ncbi:MAG: hypothetical protein ACLQJR_11760 [Stellaceae bacterium]
MKDPNAMLTPRQASKHLQEEHGITLSPETMSNLRCMGRGPMFRRDGRWIKYRLAWLDAFAAERQSPPMRSTKAPASTEPSAGASTMTTEQNGVAP